MSAAADTLTTSPTSSLRIDGVDKHFGDYHALCDLHIDVADGEFLVLVGPSGCGKSTLMRCIAGLESIDSGRILIGGQDVTRTRPSERGVAMVFQSYALYPHMTVGENIGFGMKIAKAPKAEIRAAVQGAAELLKIDHLLDRKPKALSGGQRQRVAIGRAIVHEPEIFLFDEPLSNLDAALRVEMRVELARLHGTIGNTMVYVTHDQVEAMTMASRIVVMNAGRIEQIGAPLELFNNPVNRFVAGFIGQPTTNFVSASVSREAGRVLLALPGGKPFAAPVPDEDAIAETRTDIGVRPQFFELAEADTADVIVTVDVVEQLGDETLIYTRLDDGQSITVQASGQHPIRHGDKLGVNLLKDKIMVFDADGRNLCHRTA